MLESGLDFLEKFVFQALGVGHRFFRVLVFSLEIRNGFRIVLLTQPVVIIHANMPVFFKSCGYLLYHVASEPSLVQPKKIQNNISLQLIFRGDERLN